MKSLKDNLFAAIGKRNIADLKTRDLLIPIKAVESSGRLEVAARLQQRTTAIMRFAVQSGLIDYNPAQEIAGAVATAKDSTVLLWNLTVFRNYFIALITILVDR